MIEYNTHKYTSEDHKCMICGLRSAVHFWFCTDCKMTGNADSHECLKEDYKPSHNSAGKHIP